MKGSLYDNALNHSKDYMFRAYLGLCTSPQKFCTHKRILLRQEASRVACRRRRCLRRIKRRQRRSSRLSQRLNVRLDIAKKYLFIYTFWTI